MRGMAKATIATSVLAATTLLTPGWSDKGGISLSIESAQAVIGRPLTPLSAAGVARRQHRRSAHGTGVVGAGLAGAAAIGTAAAIGGSPYSTGYYAGSSYDANAGYYGGSPYVGSYAGNPYSGGALGANAYYGGGYATDPYYANAYHGGTYMGGPKTGLWRTWTWYGW